MGAMKYVGLDLHTRQSTLAILEEGSNEIQTRTIRGPLQSVLDAVASIKGPFEICYEASTGYGVVYEAFSKVARRVVVGHPGKLRLIFAAKDKHDRGDAKKLAKLLRADLVPEVHVPPRATRSWRRLVRHRRRLVAKRTAAKVATRALLREVGTDAPKGLWTKGNRAWLSALAFEDPSDALARDDLFATVEYLEGAIRRAERRLDEVAAGHPGVALVRTIPGVGPRTAEAVVAWVADPRRFSSTKAIGKYFGLVPRESSSGGTQHLGHLTKEGPGVIRWLLNQAAWRAKASSPRIRALFERIRRDDKDRTKIAIVAVMHYLARVMLAMLRTGEVWRDSAE